MLKQATTTTHGCIIYRGGMKDYTAPGNLPEQFKVGEMVYVKFGNEMLECKILESLVMFSHETNGHGYNEREAIVWYERHYAVDMRGTVRYCQEYTLLENNYRAPDMNTLINFIDGRSDMPASYEESLGVNVEPGLQEFLESFGSE